MMVLHQQEEKIEHKKFSNILDYLKKNDLLILNNTKVFPARLYATKDRTDAKVEIFLLRELGEVGFEPTVRLRAHLISSQARSTTPAPLRGGRSYRLPGTGETARGRGTSLNFPPL